MLLKMEEVHSNSNKKLFTVISTFAGCGGSSTGYRLAGGNILSINEFVPAAIECYRKNYHNTKIFNDDIRKLKGSDFLKESNLKVGELDILDGSPPCASFSIAGKRSDHWGKIKKYSDVKQRVDDLLFEYARIVGEIKPKVFIAENVYGLVIGEAKPVFDQITNELKNKGYNVSCRLLNSKFFKVPQSRQRVIFIGVRDDYNIEPTHPKPQYKPITVREALEGIENTKEDLDPTWFPKNSKNYKYLIQMKEGESMDKYHPKGNCFNCVRDSFDNPAATILQSHGQPAFGAGIHPVEHRKYTIKELKRLSSFPDDFIVTGNFKQQWERIGRAVPPLMMKAIAEHVNYKILDVIYKRKNNYNPPFFDEEREKKNQFSFNFIKDVTDFRQY